MSARYTRRAGILAAAEQFSDPAIVAKFRSELISLREDYLALLRSRVPEY